MVGRGGGGASKSSLYEESWCNVLRVLLLIVGLSVCLSVSPVFNPLW